MQEIKCPNCGEVFVVDESGYAQIVQQVRDKEFDKELRRREEELAGKQESELRLLKLEQKQVVLEMVNVERRLEDSEAGPSHRRAAGSDLRYGDREKAGCS